ncbi:MAG: hypothetical protein K9L64_00010 [Candidatus Izimaplasma sp.]|nr:hypothetical protein [Candidatus Izimaplasma bacterium]
MILAKDSLTFLKQKIDCLLKTKPTIIIGIDGMAASGKTSLANALGNEYKVSIIHMDDFFLQDYQRTKKRLYEIAGFIDYERFTSEVIKPLQNNRSFTYHLYDCQTKTMTEEYVNNDCQVYIIEGAYALRPDFQAIYDLKVLMLIDEEKQISRIKARNKPSLVKQFKQDWLPRENRYIKEYNLKEIADIIIVE